MKYLIYSLPIFFASATFAQRSSPDAAIVEKLNEDWIHSYPTHDTATLSRIFAEDMIMITPKGSRMSKRDVLASVASQGQQILSARVDKVQVKLLGNVALVMAEASFVTVDHGKEAPGRTNYLDVYEKRNGKWVAIAAHVTFLGQ
jgi:uncharacterized protein (TIGR02246 family)